MTLAVTDNGGAQGRQQQVVDLSNLVNAPPVVSFRVVACTALTGTFDGSGSSDSDGIIANYAWAFGDGATLSGSYPKASHTYAAGGTYAVSLTVRDNIGAISIQDGSVTVVPPPLHIRNDSPVANATVSGSWSIGGTGSCTTDPWGQCPVSRSTIPRKTQSVMFTIDSVTNPMFLYKSVDNHDPDGDSNGTKITVSNR